MFALIDWELALWEHARLVSGARAGPIHGFRFPTHPPVNLCWCTFSSTSLRVIALVRLLVLVWFGR